VGQPSEGQALRSEAMITMRRNDTRLKECSTSSFSQPHENIFTPLHIELGLIKIYVKAMNKEG
jgi:hypothetical protein